MRYRRHGARLLGLLVIAALGVMALAGSARAAAPTFLVGGKSASSLLATFTAGVGVSFTLLVGPLNFELGCSETTVHGHIKDGKVGSLVPLLKKCSTKIISTKAPIACEVVEPIILESALLPAELTNGEPAILAQKVKALINLTKVGDLTKECVLPFDNALSGEICFALDGNNTAEPELLSSETIECKERKTLESSEEGAGVKDVLKYGVQVVKLDISKFKWILSKPHSGETFGVALA